MFFCSLWIYNALVAFLSRYVHWLVKRAKIIVIIPIVVTGLTCAGGLFYSVALDFEELWVKPGDILLQNRDFIRENFGHSPTRGWLLFKDSDDRRNVLAQDTFRSAIVHVRDLFHNTTLKDKCYRYYANDPLCASQRRHFMNILYNFDETQVVSDRQIREDITAYDNQYHTIQGEVGNLFQTVQIRSGNSFWFEVLTQYNENWSPSKDWDFLEETTTFKSNEANRSENTAVWWTFLWLVVCFVFSFLFTMACFGMLTAVIISATAIMNILFAFNMSCASGFSYEYSLFTTGYVLYFMLLFTLTSIPYFHQGDMWTYESATEDRIARENLEMARTEKSGIVKLSLHQIQQPVYGQFSYGAQSGTDFSHTTLKLKSLVGAMAHTFIVFNGAWFALFFSVLILFASIDKTPQQEWQFIFVLYFLAIMPFYFYCFSVPMYVMFWKSEYFEKGRIFDLILLGKYSQFIPVGNWLFRFVIWGAFFLDIAWFFYQGDAKHTSQYADRYLWSKWQETEDKYDAYSDIFSEKLHTGDLVICTNWMSSSSRGGATDLINSIQELSWVANIDYWVPAFENFITNTKNDDPTALSGAAYRQYWDEFLLMNEAHNLYYNTSQQLTWDRGTPYCARLYTAFYHHDNLSLKNRMAEIRALVNGFEQPGRSAIFYSHLFSHTYSLIEDPESKFFLTTWLPLILLSSFTFFIFPPVIFCCFIFHGGSCMISILFWGVPHEYEWTTFSLIYPALALTFSLLISFYLCLFFWRVSGHFLIPRLQISLGKITPLFFFLWFSFGFSYFYQFFIPSTRQTYQSSFFLFKSITTMFLRNIFFFPVLMYSVTRTLETCCKVPIDVGE